MTDNETTTDEVVQKHLAWKQAATERLHAVAEARDWCTDFDQILRHVGLEGRQRYIDGGYWSAIEVVGEATEADFEAWRLNTSAYLREQVRRHGVNDHGALTEAGFAETVEREVLIEGTFKIPFTITTVEGADLIATIEDWRARDQVYDNWDSDRVHWKVVVPDA